MSDAIIKDVISNGLVIFIGWAITVSLKNFIRQTVGESMSELSKKIDHVSSLVDLNERETGEMKRKLSALRSDLEKFEKTIKSISLKISHLNCIEKGKNCENAH